MAFAMKGVEAGGVSRAINVFWKMILKKNI